MPPTPKVPNSELKRRLRAELRDRRRRLDEGERKAFDQQINHHIVEWVTTTAFRSVAAFWPFDGEPDLRPALTRLIESGVRIFLPVVGSGTGSRDMEFRSWNPLASLSSNTLGIPEPGDGLLVPVQQLDLILMPLVGWSQRGDRLGMGAGYYDRALAPLRDADRPVRLGVGYEVQRADDIPADDWDILLHGVLTEKGRFTCSS